MQRFVGIAALSVILAASAQPARASNLFESVGARVGRLDVGKLPESGALLLLGAGLLAIAALARRRLSSPKQK
jgi:hypothetical protein